MVRVLTSGGKVLQSSNGKVIAWKPYAHQWGFRQARQNDTVALYDWIYRCLLDGFSVQTRTVDGVTYTVDGGYDGINRSPTGGVDTQSELHWLVIPLLQFQIPAEAGDTTNVEAFDAVFRVISDNPELLAALSPSFYSVTVSGGYVETLRMHYPYDTAALNAKRREIFEIIPTVDAYVYSETGTYGLENKPTTAAGKVAVAGALHDWLVANVENNGQQTAPTTPYYWTHNAYSCLRQLTSAGDTRLTDCNGFAVAYQFLCQMYGINCIPVMGGVGEGDGGATELPDERTNHEWNMLSATLPLGVFSDNPADWYAVDVRFDEYVEDTFNTEQSSVYFKADGVRASLSTEGWSTRRYWMSSKVYADDSTTRLRKGGTDHDYRLRANNGIGYPVEVPGAVLQGGGAG